MPCINLYRALLKQTHHLQKNVALPIKNDIRKQFRGVNGRQLRDPVKAVTALENGHAAHTLLHRAITGDTALLEKLSQKYCGIKRTSKPQRASQRPDKAPDRRKRMTEKKLSDSSSVTKDRLDKKPVKPPYLSWDSNNEYFLRPRFGRHNQSLSGRLLSRVKVEQRRLDYKAELRYLEIYAASDEEFLSRLGVTCSGWLDEVKVAQAVYEVRHREMKQAKAERTRRVKELYEQLTRDYEEDLAKWKLKMKRNKGKRSIVDEQAKT